MVLLPGPRAWSLFNTVELPLCQSGSSIVLLPGVNHGGLVGRINRMAAAPLSCPSGRMTTLGNFTLDKARMIF